MTRVLIFSPHSAGEYRDWLSDRVTETRFVAAHTTAEATALVKDADVLFTSRLTEDLVRAGDRLRWVQSMNAGIEDLVALSRIRPEIVMTRVVGEFGSSIGEYVFAELLARVRDLDRTRDAQQKRRWDRFVAGTLRDRTLGVAGLGSIGAEIVRKGRAFDMPVHGLSRTAAGAALVDRHYRPDQWPEFVAGVDVLVLTLPHTAQTEGVVDARVLAAMQPHAVLVNVGRGALVDEEALLNALRLGSIAGAVLDVFREEPLPSTSPLWTEPHTVVTPHISGPSTVPGVGHFFADNLLRWQTGQPLAGLIDVARGY